MGEVVEFYYPRNRIVATPFKAEEPSLEQPSTQMPAEDLLKETLELGAGGIQDILILIRHKDGSLNFNTNLPGLSEMLLLMEKIKLYALQHPEEVGDEGPQIS
jgi:hypothetical protein